jgi:hypothetical protein
VNDDHPAHLDHPARLTAGKGLLERVSLAIAVEELRDRRDPPVHDPDVRIGVDEGGVTEQVVPATALFPDGEVRHVG